MKSRKSGQRVFEQFAIKNLTLYLVCAQGIFLFLGLAQPGVLQFMQLVPQAVSEGQYWRLLSFLFTPPAGNPIFAAFALYLLYFMGTSLEAQWGTARYNLYVLIGYLMTVAAAFVFPYSLATNGFLTGSIFLAFAYLFPDYQIYLFFILPVRVKWLALLTWLFYGYEVFIGDWASRLLILAAVTNFLVFFGPSIVQQVRQGHRKTRLQTKSIVDRNAPIHVCTVCGVTDKSHPTMDFRYCRKCEPPVAYCSEHLATHTHLDTPAAA